MDHVVFGEADKGIPRPKAIATSTTAFDDQCGFTHDFIVNPEGAPVGSVLVTLPGEVDPSYAAAVSGCADEWLEPWNVFTQRVFNDLVHDIHRRNVLAGWWNDIDTGEDLHGKRNVGEMLCLVHSEISEAMEGHRKNLMDDKLPHRKTMEVEIADAVIRLFDLAGSEGFDLAGAVSEKLAYNAQRADHKLENRKTENGKKY